MVFLIIYVKQWLQKLLEIAVVVNGFLLDVQGLWFVVAVGL